MFKRNPGADQSENHAHGVHPRFTCLQLTQQWLCWIDFEHYLLFRHSQAGIQQELTCFHWLYVTLLVIDHATAGRCGLSDSNKYVRWKKKLTTEQWGYLFNVFSAPLILTNANSTFQLMQQWQMDVGVLYHFASVPSKLSVSRQLC